MGTKNSLSVAVANRPRAVFALAAELAAAAELVALELCFL
jgi:hypothetical protein